MMFLRLSWLFCVILLSGSVFGQLDTVRIQAFELVEETLEQNVAGTSVERIDLSKEVLRSGDNISDLLQTQSTVVLRGYGPGGSFGLSIRGSGSGQSQVLIDGIAIENPGLGSTDLSLLPVAVFSDLSIYRGGASAYLGNGAIGGSLLLGTKQHQPESSVGQLIEIGSFGKRNAVTTLNLSSKKLHSRTAFYYQEAQNDFLRKDPSNPGENQPQPNAFFKGRGLVQNFDYKFNENARLGLFLWYNKTERQIPPILSKPEAETFQVDENYRIQAGYDVDWTHMTLEIGAALDGGELNYYDENLASLSRYLNVHAQAKLSRVHEKWEAYVLGVLHQARAETDYYSKIETRNTPSIVGGWVSKFHKDNTRISLTVRQAFLNGEALPIVPVLGLEQKLGKAFTMRATVGKSYRLPGLNDLYWNPGGNPNLLPESGWFQELGFSYNKQWKKNQLNVDLIGFHREISNWIQWVPGASFWSVQNIKEVESYGGEFDVNLKQQRKRVGLNHHLGLAYVRSVNLASEQVAESITGKQLIYTPKLTVSASETVEFKGFSMRLLGYFESLRYTLSDNSKWLDAYFLLDAELSKQFEWNKIQGNVFAAARNVFDQEYQLKASHSMPGVNFEIGLKIKYKIKHK